MEIKFQINEKKEEININNEEIIGIISDNIVELKNILLLKKKNNYVKVQEQNLNEDEINTLRNKICIIEEYKNIPFINSVLDYMNYEIINNNLMIKNPNKKIIESLKIVNLDENILLRNINTLSSSEKELLNLATNLLKNPSIIILTNQFKILDLNNKKKLYRLILKLKDQYNKSIIILTKDLDIINKYCNRGIYVKNNKIYINSKINEFFNNKEKLIKSKCEIPSIIKFTYLAKELKNVKLEYHSDIRDIIKDIYKHV